MLADLDGQGLSAMEREAFDLLRLRKLIVDSVASYLVEQIEKGDGLATPSGRALRPIVRGWSSLADAYIRDLQVLGLKRRTLDVPTPAST